MTNPSQPSGAITAPRQGRHPAFAGCRAGRLRICTKATAAAPSIATTRATALGRGSPANAHRTPAHVQRWVNAAYRDQAAKAVGGRVRGDAEALRCVVRNLLDNARRHAERHVRVVLGESGGTVELTVSDDGSGIPAADRTRVFERFTRLDEARSREAGGSGLGFAIVGKVVTAHGGVAYADQDPAPDDGGLGGARLVVHLPAAPSPDVSDDPPPAAR
ncbi:sensor histidine kinase [Streptomyces sp. NPDC021212]|uniref:sensor histidine kinase n=1 Tax=Streptomyces sp. NPDC021212 TaxID=3365118 RepID=UPI00379FF3CD